MTEAQTWLDNHENNTEVIKGIDIELNGKLKIKNYPNLKSIFLVDTKEISELVIDSCPNVEVIVVNNNKITKIEGLTQLTNLQVLNFGGNKVEEIDISQNEQLETLIFYNNPSNLKFINGIKNLSKLFFLNSDDTFAITKLLEQASGADLKEIAKELKIVDVDGKTPEQIKGLIKNEIDKIEQNKTKLNNDFSGLFDQTTNDINDTKLKEIKDNFDKGKEYQKLVDEKTNAPIVDADKKEIDQTKLTDKLKNAAGYEELVENENNKELVTDGKIDQTKIDGLKTASGDAAEAIKILGVNNLKPDTLNAILGGSKLSDIHSPETLKIVLESKEKLENALKSVGINPNGDDVEKQLKDWKWLERAVKSNLGKNFEKMLQAQQYQNQVEVNTANKN